MTKVIAIAKDGGSRLLEYEGKLYFENRSIDAEGTPQWGIITYADAPTRYKIDTPVPEELAKKIIEGIDEKIS